MSPEAREQAGAAIADKLCTLGAFRNASSVLGYMSLPDEVDTGRVLSLCLAGGKRLALPRIREDQSAFDAALVRDIDADLVDGPFKIRQPAARCALLEVSEIDLILVPGRAFDRRGNRVGRGGGMYDRFLSQRGRAAPAVGLAYACQVFAVGVQADERDVGLEILVTEIGIQRFTQGS